MHDASAFIAAYIGPCGIDWTSSLTPIHRVVLHIFPFTLSRTQKWIRDTIALTFHNIYVGRLHTHYCSWTIPITSGMTYNTSQATSKQNCNVLRANSLTKINGLSSTPFKHQNQYSTIVRRDCVQRFHRVDYVARNNGFWNVSVVQNNNTNIDGQPTLDNECRWNVGRPTRT